MALAKILGNKLPIACGKDFSLGRSSYFYMDVAKRIQYGETTMPKEAEANGIRYTKFKIALLSSLPA